jgi:hypothetical protein
MKRTRTSRVKDKRADIKVSAEVYGHLIQVKKLLEEARAHRFSMSEVLALLFQWSEGSINELTETRTKLNSLTTKKKPHSWIQ